ncbi:unnamed protein product [Rangifer tarandus platyrhynchus]|uniref:Uncharacterized protein n=1 Tax=Rangifer tarandus platyrhynchus TaxID=3082113 RepID=A0ABN8XMI0_RANTA|nr:unnamed protein product [Rangifer tarandus platyrhynchus]
MLAGDAQQTVTGYGVLTTRSRYYYGQSLAVNLTSTLSERIPGTVDPFRAPFRLVVYVEKGELPFSSLKPVICCACRIERPLPFAAQRLQQTRRWRTYFIVSVRRRARRTDKDAEDKCLDTSVRLDEFDVSGPPQLPAAATEGGAQQPQERNLQLQRRFTDGLQRRLVAATDALAKGEAAVTETVSQGKLRWKSELDDLLGDVPAYRRLLRQRELNKIAERYADEEELDPNEFSILSRARSHLRDLHRRKSMWAALSRSLLVTFVLALFVLSSLTSPVGPTGTPLNYAERRTRRNEFCVAAALTLGVLMVALYGEWRRRALNNQIYLQELKTDRITFEAVAGLRPLRRMC